MNLFVTDLKNSYRPSYKNNMLDIQIQSVKQQLNSVKIDLLQNHNEIMKKLSSLERFTGKFQPNSANCQLQAENLEKETIIAIMQEQIDSLQIQNEILTEEKNGLKIQQVQNQQMQQNVSTQLYQQQTADSFEVLNLQKQAEQQKTQNLEIKQYLLTKNSKDEKMAQFRQQQKKNEKILFQMRSIVKKFKENINQKDDVISSLTNQINQSQNYNQIKPKLNMVNDTEQDSLITQCKSILDEINQIQLSSQNVMNL